MGLWQLAQAALVLSIPIHTIYPVRGESTIRYDFIRIFFSIEYPAERYEEPLVVMWTGIQPGTVPFILSHCYLHIASKINYDLVHTFLQSISVSGFFHLC